MYMSKSEAIRRDGMGRSLHYTGQQMAQTAYELEQMADLVRTGRDNEAASAVLVIKWRLGEHLAYLDKLLAAIHEGR